MTSNTNLRFRFAFLLFDIELVHFRIIAQQLLHRALHPSLRGIDDVAETTSANLI
jgi:hypothetical protein